MILKQNLMTTKVEIKKTGALHLLGKLTITSVFQITSKISFDLIFSLPKR